MILTLALNFYILKNSILDFWECFETTLFDNMYIVPRSLIYLIFRGILHMYLDILIYFAPSDNFFTKNLPMDIGIFNDKYETN